MEAATGSPSLPSLALTATLFGMIACASVPSTPGGPLQHAGVVQVSETQIYDVSRIQITTDQGGKQGFQTDIGGFALLTVRLGGRVAITDWFDGAGDWGSADSGAEIRAGLPEGERPLHHRACSQFSTILRNGHRSQFGTGVPPTADSFAQQLARARPPRRGRH